MNFNPDIREAFAQAYTRIGNSTAALTLVLGAERSARMQPHTLRARASELLNDYRVANRIEEIKQEIMASGGVLPKYRKRTYRSDLMKEAEAELNAEPPKTTTKNKAIQALYEQIERLKRGIRKPRRRRKIGL